MISSPGKYPFNKPMPQLFRRAASRPTSRRASPPGRLSPRSSAWRPSRRRTRRGIPGRCPHRPPAATRSSQADSGAFTCQPVLLGTLGGGEPGVHQQTTSANRYTACSKGSARTVTTATETTHPRRSATIRPLHPQAQSRADDSLIIMVSFLSSRAIRVSVTIPSSCTWPVGWLQSGGWWFASEAVVRSVVIVVVEPVAEGLVSGLVVGPGVTMHP